MRAPLMCIVLVIFAAGLAIGQDTNFATGPQYLNYGSPLFARPISTPSLSMASPPLEVGASNATAGLSAGAENGAILQPGPDASLTVNLIPIYYGPAPASNIEVTLLENSSHQSNEIPDSILDIGVFQITTAEALRASGYGVTVARAAAQSKLTGRHATRVYTNADIDRLRRKS